MGKNSSIQKSLIFCSFFLLTSLIFASPGISQDTLAEQTKDEEYGKLINEATTLPQFISPLVNYLPRVEGVPTPKDVLGYIVGAPGKLTYYDDILRYMNALDSACDNVQVFKIGKTGEGREMVVVAISNVQTIQKLQSHKDLMAQLADPRIVKTEKEANEIISMVKPAYLLTQNLHSPESGSAETCMELAYRLAVDNHPIVQKIRDNLIILINPSAEPDGHDKHTDWFYKYNLEVTKRDKVSRVPYWGKYDLHDNNRDMITMSQPEMQNIAKTFYDWHPIVLQDNHEIGYLFYVSSANGPSNFPPSTGSEANLMAWFEVSQMTAYGMPGVYTHDFGNTMWSPNFMASIAPSHNAIFRFYETYGNAIANTMETEAPERVKKEQWYRPLPPPDKFKWSLRNNVNYQQTGDLLAFYCVASNKKFFLKNFWKRGLEAYTAGQNEPPYAYIIPVGQKDPQDMAFLINVLLKQKIEVHKAKSEIKIGEKKYPKGSYVIRMDQPYRNLAILLLGTQKYPKDPGTRNVYDDAGWTLGFHMDVKTHEIKDKAIYDAAVSLVKEPVKPVGKVTGKTKTGAYIFNNGTINSLITARIKLKDFKALAAEAPFQIDKIDFDAGSIIFPISDSADELHDAVVSVAKELGLEAVAVKKVPDVKTHELDIPRIAILHTWYSTQNDGWVRFAFDQLEIPYAYIHKNHVRQGNLKDKYDVIVFSDCGGRSGADIVNGIDPERNGPLAFVRCEKFKHLGTPDSCEDITGGMGIAGALNLQKFIQDGGVLLALSNPVRLVLDFGFIRGLRISSSAAFHPGSLLKGEVANSKHPAVYGYEKETALYRHGRSPLLNVPKDMEKYVVAKYASKGEVCLSGMVRNPKDLQGKAAILDVPVGKGHILMFTFNPFWRDTNHGNYMFVFNSILNYNDLDVGIVEEEKEKDKEKKEK